jgi:hypothetical protein
MGSGSLKRAVGLNPLGRFHKHNHMHAGTIPMVFDEFGRCAYCVKNGRWKPND